MVLCNAQNKGQNLKVKQVVTEASKIPGVNEYFEEEEEDTINKKTEDKKNEMDKLKDFMKIQET